MPLVDTPCPRCSSSVQQYNINLNCDFYMCMNSKCSYPFDTDLVSTFIVDKPPKTRRKPAPSPPPSSPVVQRQLKMKRNRSFVSMSMLNQRKTQRKPFDRVNANAVGQGGLPLLSAPPVQKENMGSFSDDVFNHPSSLDITLQNSSLSPSTQELNYSLADIEHLLQHDDEAEYDSEHSTVVTPKDIDSLLDKSTLMDDFMVVTAQDLFNTNCT
ncbi:unnamed protein product [Umbelopsis ramanniana]